MSIKLILGKKEGSAIIATLLLVFAVVAAGAVVFNSINAKFRTTYHSSAWVEALNAAEAGAELGVQALKSGTDFTAWTTPWTAGSIPAPFSVGCTGTFPAHGSVATTTCSVLVTAVTTDASTWYRVRSTGIVGIPGSTMNRAANFETVDRDVNGVKNPRSILRRLLLGSTTPVVKRTVELGVLVTPKILPMFPRVLTTGSSITFNGGTWFDSFDSTDPNRSINGKPDPSDPTKVIGGQYPGKDAAKTGTMGDIATYSSLDYSLWATQATPKIYGNGNSQGGTWPPVKYPYSWDHATITGTVNTNLTGNFSTLYPGVKAPSWGAGTTGKSLLSGTGWSTWYVPGGSGTTATQYVYSDFLINGSAIVHLSNPNSDGSDTYVNIYVNGDFNITAGGSLVLDKGVHATFWVDGNITVSGGGVTNNGYGANQGIAGNLLLYGIPATSGSRTCNVLNGGIFMGTIYAPTFPFTLSGGTSYTGGGVFKTANIQGSGAMHYDEALGKTASNAATNGGVKVISWAEDTYTQKDNPSSL